MKQTFLNEEEKNIIIEIVKLLTKNGELTEDEGRKVDYLVANDVCESRGF